MFKFSKFVCFYTHFIFIKFRVSIIFCQNSLRNFLYFPYEDNKTSLCKRRTLFLDDKWNQSINLRTTAEGILWTSKTSAFAFKKRVDISTNFLNIISASLIKSVFFFPTIINFLSQTVDIALLWLAQWHLLLTVLYFGPLCRCVELQAVVHAVIGSACYDIPLFNLYFNASSPKCVHFLAAVWSWGVCS